MKTYRIFVDGQEGTTGLEITERLASHPSVTLLTIAPDKRKDPTARAKLLNGADLSFLCLPDQAARESAELTTSPDARLVDASTAHRIDPDWTFGLPELSPDQRKKIAVSMRTSVPGCHSTAFLLSLVPLVREKIIPPDYPIAAQSITGYSGGGKKLIAAYAPEGPDAAELESPRPYALKLSHKHLPEMRVHSGLSSPPLFMPVVSNYYKGLAVFIPLFTRTLPGHTQARRIHEILTDYYHGERFVRVIPFDGEGFLADGFFDVTGCNNTNRADVFVFGNDDQTLLVTRLDNLGKGASGAAVQCMNLMLGLPENAGLNAD
ncbi:MAG TPA: N-acetyl-gamma-glutamyl-phosphate reductase [Spirochaetia bacterium]|nr:N-acetyl-gamma-glutamyl-phosphate reductase [Spirochaetia bacterium]